MNQPIDLKDGRLYAVECYNLEQRAELLRYAKGKSLDVEFYGNGGGYASFPNVEYRGVRVYYSPASPDNPQFTWLTPQQWREACDKYAADNAKVAEPEREIKAGQVWRTKMGDDVLILSNGREKLKRRFRCAYLENGLIFKATVDACRENGWAYVRESVYPLPVAGTELRTFTDEELGNFYIYTRTLTDSEFKAVYDYVSQAGAPMHSLDKKWAATKKQQSLGHDFFGSGADNTFGCWPNRQKIPAITPAEFRARVDALSKRDNWTPRKIEPKPVVIAPGQVWQEVEDASALVTIREDSSDSLNDSTPIRVRYTTPGTIVAQTMSRAFFLENFTRCPDLEWGEVGSEGGWGKNPKINDLPEPLRVLAEANKESQKGTDNRIAFDTCFDWSETEQGFDFWSEVYHGRWPAKPVAK